MKIAFVTDSTSEHRFGGKEMRYKQIFKQLQERKIDFCVYTMGLAHQKKFQSKKFKTISKFRPIYVKDRRSVATSLLFSLDCFRLLGEEFDVLEADQIPFLPVFTLWLVCKLKKKPLVVTWHEVWSRSQWDGYLGRFLGFFAHAVQLVSLKLPNFVICVSEETESSILLLGILGRQRLRVIKAGLDHNPKNQRNKQQKIKKGAAFTYVGRLKQHKRVDLLLQALALLKSEGFSFNARIVGEGPEGNALMEQARKLNLDKENDCAVNFLGNIPDGEEFEAILSSTDVFVSASEREGFGIAAAEAIVSGTKVVISDHPENASLSLIEKVPGCFSFKNGSAEDLASKLKKASDSNAEPNEILGTFLQLHPDLTWEKSVDALTSVLAELSKQNSGGRSV